ncbi:LolA family protein [Alicyclobacillus fastidiosus]|uniref:Outer membrane lipoprotein carrier protein LolA n=1 Tax=Alicyclobacillus fastidiosus TaxID=392011 RepID=A0ABV5AF17_9BACL|nr:outer membrane lipoprotein carrier protein LolA [Alicyclobacillus fastidiosus]WEH12163.1 outer membrane lipoprotein carrier protein LolA [Alicyclobacillus fastidiosus]
MRKVTAVVLALGLVGGVVVGCGVPTGKSVNQKIQTQAQQLDSTNYQSDATMTVQMDNNTQTYSVQVSYESPTTYKITLGNQDKQVHQVIVHNDNGMFIVSPSLQKVFRFNGDWAKNQGQIYLYDQLLKQITTTKNVKMTKGNGEYIFNVPVTPASDTISTQQVVLDSKTLEPKTVKLLDKDGKPAVTLTFKSFNTNVKFKQADFDPQSMVSSQTKTTMTSDDEQAFGYVEPKTLFGTKLTSLMQPSETSAVMKFGGDHHYLLQEWRPTPGQQADPEGQLVDMYGVPAMYTDGNNVSSLTWLNNGVEYAITSNDLNQDQLEQIAMSTLSQVGK